MTVLNPPYKSEEHRYRIRQRMMDAALLAVAHRSSITYTEGWQRWDGITNKRLASKGEFPLRADCSALNSWCGWTATRPEDADDFMNGLNWGGGYTGTMVQHGIAVEAAHLLTADSVFYGGSIEVPQHVAIYIGDGRVVSHGMEGDPRVYPTDLHGVLPIVGYRRYIV